MRNEKKIDDGPKFDRCVDCDAWERDRSNLNGNKRHSFPFGKFFRIEMILCVCASLMSQEFPASGRAKSIQPE